METKGTALALPHKGSKQPWIVYDMFVQGVTVDEIVMQFALQGATRDEANEASVKADIETMRGFECKRWPRALLTDEDCDQLRRLYLLIRAARADGSAGAIKTANELGIRSDVILHNAHRRYEE